MKSKMKLLLAGAVLAIAVGVWSGTAPLAGIRIDGTEFQQASGRAGSIEKKAGIDSLKLVYTFGQAVLAQGELPSGDGGTPVKIGLGYEYNVQATTDFGCTCPNQGDSDVDGVKTVLDLAGIIDAIFNNAPNPQDPLCPTYRYDLDCDGITSALDLAYAVDFLFYGGPGPCDPCAE